jgi:hypothetical protein
MPHLLANGFSRMVFEHLWDCFHPKDLASGFPQLFQLFFHIVKGHIPLQIVSVFGTACFLTMTKLLGGVRPIVMGETLYRLTIHTLCFQFCDAFVTHFSPHQFKVATKCCHARMHDLMQ